MRRKLCKGVFAVCIAFALAFSILPTTFAADPVATDGSTSYESLQEAITAAGNVPTTVTLLGNIDLGAGKITVNQGQNITIDFAGYRITGLVSTKLTANHYMIHNKGGTLTLMSSRSGGGATLEYRGESTNYGYTADTICNDVGGDLTVKSGVYYNNTNVSAQISYVLDCLTNGNTKTTTTVIDGGSFISPYYLCVRAFANGTAMNSLTINGGDFTGRITLQDANASANKSELIIKDGEFTANSCSSEVVYLYGNKDASNLSVSIEGGTYDGSVYLTSVNTTETFDAEISGGTFNEPVWVCTWDTSSEDTNVPAVTGGDFAYSVADYLDPSLSAELCDGGRFSYYPTVDDARDAASGDAVIKDLAIPANPSAAPVTVVLINGSNMTTYGGLYAGSYVLLPELGSTQTRKFLGWTDASGNSVSGGYTVSGDETEDVIFRANWASIVYELVLNAGEGGSIKGSFTAAAVGNKAYITVTPDEGYELGSVTAVDKDGNAVALTLADGKYALTMPASKVTVYAEFTEIEKVDVLEAFEDVNPLLWYVDGLRFCVENGILEGTPEGKLLPGGDVSRAEAMVMLWRMAGSPESSAENPFDDVEADTWYSAAVIWGAEKGIVSGATEEFLPADKVSFEEFICLLANFASKNNGETVESDGSCLGRFNDADKISPYAVNSVAWAVDKGLIVGDDKGNIIPEGDTTRARIATVIVRFFTAE